VRSPFILLQYFQPSDYYVLTPLASRPTASVPTQASVASASLSTSIVPAVLLKGTLVRHPPWHAAPPVGETDETEDGDITPSSSSNSSSAGQVVESMTKEQKRAQLDEIRSLFRVIAHESGPDRRPPNLYDLRVRASLRTSFLFICIVPSFVD
jgi:hypothetical protein